VIVGELVRENTRLVIVRDKSDVGLKEVLSDGVALPASDGVSVTLNDKVME